MERPRGVTEVMGLGPNMKDISFKGLRCLSRLSRVWTLVIVPALMGLLDV